MILPRLIINDDMCHLETYDPEAPDLPLFVMEGRGNGITTVADVFMSILLSATENYADGYDIGYNDALDDMEGGEFIEGVVY